MTTAKTFCFRCLVWGVIPLLLAMGLPYTANRAEHRYMPVVEDFVVLDMQVTQGSAVMSGVMNKVRNCQYLGLGATAIYNTGETDAVPVWTRGTINGQSFTRPTGSQAWGPWVITVPISPATVAIKFDLVHRCHLLWSSATDLGVIPLTKPR